MSRIVINDLNNDNNYLSILNEEELSHVLGGFKLSIFGIKILQIGGDKLKINLGATLDDGGIAVTATVTYNA